MRNADKHAKELIDVGGLFAVVDDKVVACTHQCSECLFKGSACNYTRMEWLLKDVSLTYDEKKYLSYVIKPFKARVTYLNKKQDRNYEYLEIVYEDLEKCKCSVWLPNFIRGSMYKGMEINKEYTVEELGL